MNKVSKANYQIKEGNYKERGIVAYHKGFQLTVAAKNVRSLVLVLYGKKSFEQTLELELPLQYKKGNLYSYYIEGIDATEVLYQIKINGKIYTDPYAKALAGRESWGEKHREEQLYCGFYKDMYDWQGDCRLKYRTWELIIYKLHVRGFTKHKTSKVKKKGTFLGIVEKIPYLKELGITAIEVMPAYEFEEVMERENYYQPSYVIEETKNTEVLNYWGYGKGNYFVPKASYAATDNPQKEWKDTIKELHKQGIEVIMEFSFGRHEDQNMIVDCVKYWVEEYHIDGVHLYGANLPIALLAQHPMLSEIKIFQNYQDTDRVYAEDEIPEMKNLMEYNDGFEGCARRLLKGDGGQINDFVYRNRKNEEQQGVINFIANHDGFTLYDSVSYEKKHNRENGEAGKDGNNYNYTWNCGIEGTTRKKMILDLRKKQIKNAFAMVLLSQGSPLILAGDEWCNSQKGNNNAYCQDNEISWVIWQENAFQKEIYSFVKHLIAFRKKHPILSGAVRLRVMDYLACGYPDVSYHGEKAWTPYFDDDSRYVGIMYCGNYACIDKKACDDFFYIAYNLHWEKHVLALPNLPKGQKWFIVADTSKGAGNDWMEEGEEQLPEGQKGVEVAPRSIVILQGKSIRGRKGKKSGISQSRGGINEHMGTFQNNHEA